MKRNKYLSRLHSLKNLIENVCSGMSMDSICGGSKLTISNVITDLDECIKWCNADVDYRPPAYYLKQLNSIYKHYNSKTYAS